MCKSRAGQCYTALEVRGEDTHLTHGCLDSLPEHHRALCQKLADPASSTAIHADGDVAVAGYERASPGKPTHSERSQHPVSASTPRSPREPDRRSSRNSDSSGGSSSSSNLSAGMHHHHQQELLQQQPQQQRQGQVQDPSAPTLLCCTEHMCNYREDTDITMNLMPKLNSTYQRGKTRRSSMQLSQIKLHLSER
ncbi:hypothetical protein RRG08_034363 [Elysia crispata]|uniref:Uncharacterized protein n=1 Tax=Elysia crispata TaxID=231223 RepID=A0AAE1CWE2_9GAST|nr:hypothetical protein RRG08_034363 [Elysia crispata]